MRFSTGIHRTAGTALAAALLLALLSVTAHSSARAAERVSVVASFAILADMVKNVGGEHVQVTSLIGPGSDAHSYSPSPGDVRTLSRARLVVFNGLNFEGWMERLLDTSGYEGTRVTATRGIAPLRHAGRHGHDDIAHAGNVDPHAWQDITRAKTYVANIRDGLIKADPGRAAAYRANADAYLARLDKADADIRRRLAGIPADTAVITGHASFGYFADAYGLRFLAPEGLATAAAPSAARMAELIEQIKADNVQALFYEHMASASAVDQLAEDTGLRVAGTLYAGTLAHQGPASHYLGMMRHNARVLHEALRN
ncbi:metal ABC transporter substrate-binding protein [Halomonas cibimaris]|uniref:Metal ABC transporter substrate-binding protein n=1 Tax=Halomonas cibimaris TaxID=657012 RepID=A0ABP7LYI8_9GAMM